MQLARIHGGDTGWPCCNLARSLTKPPLSPPRDYAWREHTGQPTLLATFGVGEERDGTGLIHWVETGLTDEDEKNFIRWGLGYGFTSLTDPLARPVPRPFYMMKSSMRDEGGCNRHFGG